MGRVQGLPAKEWKVTNNLHIENSYEIPGIGGNGFKVSDEVWNQDNDIGYLCNILDDGLVIIDRRTLAVLG